MPRSQSAFPLLLLHTAKILSPDPDAIAKAWTRAEKLADELHRSKAAMFRVVECINHGSTSRGTAINGFQDLDALIALNATSLRTGGGSERTPSDTISRMARALEERRKGLVNLGTLDIRRQDHSVGVSYLGKNRLRVDLVPAIKLRSGKLKIPERGSGEWITTNPPETKRRLENACDLEPSAIDAIRLLKGWKRARGHNAPIPSFAIETLVVDTVLAGVRGIDVLVRSVFEEIRSKDARRRIGLGGARPGTAPVTLIDPVSQANLTEEMNSSQRGTLVRTSRDAFNTLAEIQTLCQRGELSKAMTRSRRLFLGRWQ